MDHDLDGINNLVTACCRSTDAGEEETIDNHHSTEPSESLDAALKEYFDGQRSQSRFNEVASKQNITVKQLAYHRLERAATMRNAGKSFAEITRSLGVKTEKLKKFMADGLQ